ncbi:Protein CBG20325 [Caenorhabditis briggsae]|uniref:Protein CBG20325 n=1 Tax=Caenorhabditis briggsae TaxID=6238 RepID=A8XXJ7_CAEBR|nr:Protein CBG20325 [Caenorhabditis briggsae]CAP37366.2 Protein CBG20325 [Caenorhabditis briggsae]
MEFGGGLGRFSISPPIKNKCREIVEVPGGPEWKIRKLREEFDEFCWKYPGSSVIVYYHLKRLQKTVPNFFEDHQIFVSVACAVQELGIWYRGKIAQISGEEHVVVELVDFGTQILVPRHHIRPLIRRFGRAPPLCLKCRADGITINDLEIKDLHDFKNIILDCNALFRVEIKSLEEPFLNEVFHEDDEDFKEEHGDGDYFPSFHPTTVIPDHQTIVQKSQKFISRLPKCARAPRFEQDTLLIDHIENAQLVYLQYPWQVSKRSKIDDFLRATWQNLPKIPEKFRQKDQICAIRNPRIDFVVGQ